MPLFAEPLAPHPIPGDRRRVVVDTARRIGALGVDVLKLEYPVAAEESDEDEWLEACLEVTAASPCPWTVLSAGIDFETFVRQFTVACTAGASGFVAGRTIWGNLVAGGLDEKQKAEAIRRLSILTEIAVNHARPWTVWANQPDETVVEAGEVKSE
jgi:tagatose 1,6-diphosphate aldolase